MSKQRKPQRKKPPEFWGAWTDKSHLLVHHPLQKRGLVQFDAAYNNLVLSVQVSTEASEWGDIVHLWIRRHDGQAPTWRQLQRVKNSIVGSDRTAVEVYPATEDLVDVANMYHLWVLPAGFRLPFGLNDKQED